MLGITKNSDVWVEGPWGWLTVKGGIGHVLGDAGADPAPTVAWGFYGEESRTVRGRQTSVTGVLVLGGQEWHHLQFNSEMEMSRQRRTRAGSPGSGSQRLAPPPPSKQQCCARRAGSLRRRAQRVPRVPRTRPQQEWPLLGQEPQAGQRGDAAGAGDASHPARSGSPASPRAPTVGTALANATSLFSPHSMTEKEVPEPPASPASGGKPKSRVSGCPQGSLGG